MRSRWKRIRYHLEWAGLFLATKLIPLCSRKACYRLAQLAGALLSFLDRHRYHVALSNLEVAFGNQLSARERRKIARESFQQFARTMVDLLWSPRLTPLNFLWYIELQNFEETMRDTGPERSVIIACYHYSNFEWLSLACGFLDLKGTIISQEFKNSLLDPIFKKLREQSGHELIPRERGIIRLYKVLRRKGRTALLVDLTVPPSQGAVAIEVRGEDEISLSAVRSLDHYSTRLACLAERSFLRALGGGCQLPIAAHAVLEGDELAVDGLVASQDGKQIVRDVISGKAADAELLGTQLAERLISLGANSLLQNSRT